MSLARLARKYAQHSLGGLLFLYEKAESRERDHIRDTYISFYNETSKKANRRERIRRRSKGDTNLKDIMISERINAISQCKDEIFFVVLNE